MSEDDWTWEYEGYEPSEEKLRESLCTLGNGRFATRGAAPECDADEVHYPGTYGAGCYNRLTSTVDGHQVDNEDMVNLPNWLPLRLRITGEHGDGPPRAPYGLGAPPGQQDAPPAPWLTPDAPALREHRQLLRLDRGLLERRLRYEDEQGRILTVCQLRLVHMGDPYLAVLRTEVRGGELLRPDRDRVGARRQRHQLRCGPLPRSNGRHLTDVRTGSTAPDRCG